MDDGPETQSDIEAYREWYSGCAWFAKLDERQQNEVLFAIVYEAHFSHGTDGHNRLLLISKLVDMLGAAEYNAERIVRGVEVEDVFGYDDDE